MFEHQYPLFIDDESDPFYHAIPQRFVALVRFAEGGRTATNLTQTSYSNDNKTNMHLLDQVTGTRIAIPSADGPVLSGGEISTDEGLYHKTSIRWKS